MAGLKAAAEWAARDSPDNPRLLPDTKGKLSGTPCFSEGPVGVCVARKCLPYGTMHIVLEVLQGDSGGVCGAASSCRCLVLCGCARVFGVRWEDMWCFVMITCVFCVYVD